ncbi:HAMP domain-containing sensor histidine kinase [Embleya sp. NPDC005575]|uniref:sensor histidine kinase n=1 Tax=Embleya sp. NPDC005575 TaxID=3156892 RepID=UPI0033B0B425
MRRRPSTLRVRLTALYAGLFVAAVTPVLIAVNVLLDRLIGGGAPKRRLAEPVLSGMAPAEGTPPAEGMPPAPPIAHKDVAIAVTEYQWTVTCAAIVLFAVLGAAAGWWVSGRALRPVHRITATARRLSLSNLHERIALTGPHDELKELADTFDAMLERLACASDSQRRFAANASHELRTPLTIQRAAIEIGLEDPTPDQLARMRRELLDANLRTERLIDGLLALAQGERGPEHPESVDLAELVGEVVAQYREPADRAGVTLDVRTRSAPGVGDPVMLTRLIANLVHNAIRHNHPGGRVFVDTCPDTGLTVRNTGPSIPADRVPELFEPFRRLHPPRTGSIQGAGLGLSIAAAITDAHGARLAACPNPDGGLTVTFALPRVAAAPPAACPQRVRGRSPDVAMVADGDVGTASTFA